MILNDKSNEFGWVFQVDYDQEEYPVLVNPRRFEYEPYTPESQRQWDKIRRRRNGHTKTGGCPGTQVVQFLLVRHYGVPRYIRWWLRWRGYDGWKGVRSEHFDRGCGCIVKIKAAQRAVQGAWRYWKSA